MKTILALLLLLIPLYSNGQKSIKKSSSPTVSDQVKQIAISNKYESSHVGFAGSASEQYKRMKELTKAATQNELLQLTRHTNAAVRIYSYLALRTKNYEKAQSIYKTLSRDTAAIFTLEGC